MNLMINNELSTEEIVSIIREWSIDRIYDIDPESLNASAIYSEFEEWINPGDEDIEIVSLEQLR